jgi:hypothetical protein
LIQAEIAKAVVVLAVAAAARLVPLPLAHPPRAALQLLRPLRKKCRPMPKTTFHFKEFTD